MAYSTQCPRCGATVRLPESDAGTRVLCLSCGSTFMSRPLAAADAEPSPDEPLAGLLDDSFEREPARIDPPAAQPLAPPPRTSPGVYVAITAAAVIVLGLLGAGFYWAMRTPPMPAGNVADSRARTSAAQEVDRGGTPATHAAEEFDDAATSSPTQPATKPAKPKRPAPVSLPEDPSVITDDRIGQAMQLGVNHLLAQFDPKTAQLRETLSGGDEGYVC